jgi:hypothetical protein
MTFPKVMERAMTTSILAARQSSFNSKVELDRAARAAGLRRHGMIRVA